MTYGHRRRRPGPYDRGTYPITVSQAQAAAGTVLHSARMRLMGWSLASTGSDSLSNYNTAVAPAAGAHIAQLLAVPPGDYIAAWSCELTGPAAAADEDNFSLTGGSLAGLHSLNQPAAGIYEQLPVVITLAAAGTVKVIAVGAGTVGVTYAAQLTLTPLAAGAIGQLLDAGQLLGITSTGADQLDTEWFGDEGVYVGTSIAVLATSGNLSGVVYVCDEPADHEEDEPSQRSSASPRPPSPQAHP